MSTVLAAHGLVKKYGPTHALAGVDVEVGERDSLAVMGPSGSGKSTLLHILAGIVRPDEGQVLLHHDRIDNLGENKLSALRRARFGFVFQFGQLLPELPAEENVALPLMLEGTPRRQAVERARRWFAPLGLDGLEQRRPGQLSGGQAGGPPSGGGSPSPAPWSSSRTWCSPTSRPAPWTGRPAARSYGS